MLRGEKEKIFNNGGVLALLYRNSKMLAGGRKEQDVKFDP